MIGLPKKTTYAAKYQLKLSADEIIHKSGKYLKKKSKLAFFDTNWLVIEHTIKKHTSQKADILPKM